MKYQELEIKLLNINKEEFISKLENINAKYIESRIQKIYTYDCYDPILMYNLAISDYKISKSNNSLKKIKNIVSYFEPIFDVQDKKVFKKVLGFSKINEYIDNEMGNVDITKLKNKEVLNVIKKCKDKFFKWIRLRQDGEKVELTIKYIYNTSVEYNIDQVKEVEILVDDFETANKIIEEMGYYRRKIVEKKRISYEYDNMSIDIDEWPLLDPYVEIEGENPDKIYKLAKLLGFHENDIKVMNTEDVYLQKGINLTDYEVMCFDVQKRN